MSRDKIKRVSFEFDLDENDVYESQVIKVLESVPARDRKQFLINSILYYSKSPVVDMTKTMEKYLSSIDDLGKRLDRSVGVLGDQIRDYQVTIDDIEAVIRRVFSSTGGISLSDSTVEVDKDDGMDDVFEKMAGEYISSESK